MRLRSDNRSGHPGVKPLSTGRYEARIKKEGRFIHLGNFATLAEAKAARQGAERSLGFSRTHGAGDRPTYAASRVRVSSPPPTNPAQP
jgi:hypothetical protein